ALEAAISRRLELPGPLQLFLQGADARLVDVRVFRGGGRLSAQRRELVDLEDEESGICVARRHAALDAQERVDLELILGDPLEPLRRGIETQELPASAQ